MLETFVICMCAA